MLYKYKNVNMFSPDLILDIFICQGTSVIYITSLVHTVPVLSPGVASVWAPGPHRSDTDKHCIESG